MATIHASGGQRATQTDLATKALLAMGQKKGLNLTNKSRLRTLAGKARNKIEDLHEADPMRGKRKVSAAEEEEETSDEEASRDESVYSMSDSEEEVRPRGQCEEQNHRKASRRTLTLTTKHLRCPPPPFHQQNPQEQSNESSSSESEENVSSRPSSTLSDTITPC